MVVFWCRASFAELTSDTVEERDALLLAGRGATQLIAEDGGMFVFGRRIAVKGSAQGLCYRRVMLLGLGELDLSLSLSVSAGLVVCWCGRCEMCLGKGLGFSREREGGTRPPVQSNESTTQPAAGAAQYSVLGLGRHHIPVVTQFSISSSLSIFTSYPGVTCPSYLPVN